MSRQFKTIGFRNGLFVGDSYQLKNEHSLPNGIGICIDDMFLACLSSWHSQSQDQPTKPRGPSVILYPNRQIFYAQQFPKNNKLKGFWSYIIPNLQIFGDGQNRNIAILHPSGEILTRVSLDDLQRMVQSEQIQFKSEPQKWNKIQQIIGSKVPQSKRDMQNFIDHYFLNKLKQDQKQANYIKEKKRGEQSYGIINNNQGIIFKISKKQDRNQVGSVGFYKSIEPKKVMAFGREYIDEASSTMYRICQGNFDTQQQIYNFQISQKRPAQSYKTSRKYFRQKTTFSNKFLQISQVDQIYKRLSNICKAYINNIALRYGQKIIQGNDHKSPENKHEQQKKNINSRANHYDNKQQYINREYNLQQAKIKIQQQINRRRSQGNFVKTGTFMFKPQQKNTKQKQANQIKLFTRDKSPLYSSIYKQIQITTRNKKQANRSSPRKFMYTDPDQVQNQQRKIQKSQQIVSVYNNSDIRQRNNALHENYKPGPLWRPTVVNQFKIQPLLEREMDLLKERQKQRQREILMEKQIIRRAVQRQDFIHQLILRKEMERNSNQIKLIQKQNQRNLILQCQELLLPRRRQAAMLNSPKINAYNPILKDKNFQIPFHSGYGNESYRRKYYPKINYTQQTQRAVPRPSGTPLKPAGSTYNHTALNSNQSPRLSQNQNPSLNSKQNFSNISPGQTSRLPRNVSISPMNKLGDVSSNRARTPTNVRLTSKKYNYFD